MRVKSLEQEINTFTQHYSKTTSGLVRLTCVAHLSRDYILPTIQNIQKDYPDIVFEVAYDDRRTDLVKEEFDMAIRVWKPQDSTLIGQKLRSSRLLLVATPAFLEQFGRPATISELANLPSACYARLGVIRDKIRYYDQYDRIQTVDMNPAYRTSSSESLLQSVKANMYYTMITDHNLGNELASGELIELFPETRFPEEDSIYAVYPNRDLSFGARLFIESLKERFQSHQ